MLGRRLFSAAIIISTMLLLIWGDFYLGRAEVLGRPGLILCGLAIVVACLAAGELISMWKSTRLRLNMTVGITCTGMMVAVSSVRVLWSEYPRECPVGTFGWAMLGLSVAIGLAFLWEMWTYTGQSPETNASENSTSLKDEYDKQGEIAGRLSHYALCFGYVMMLVGFLVPHRLLGHDNGLGMLSLIALIATVKMSDSSAYFVGKCFGKKKLVPKLSPGKTVAGAFGAIGGGWLGAAIVVFLVAPFVFGFTVDKPWWWFLLYGFAVTVAGMIGDLAESLLKRDSATKDSSRWLPGLGGVLDVIDSLVFAAPISFFLWI